MNWAALVGLTVVAYLLGSFPSGVIWGRAIKGVDVRQFGSGKTGATNSLRTLGWQVSALVFVSDMTKGALAVAIPLLLASAFFKIDGQDFTHWAVLTCGMAAVIGHNHSIFINFQGGRGVACGMGQVLVVSPLAMLLIALVCVPVLLISRYVSLTSLVGCVLAFVFLAANIWITNLNPLYLVWGFFMPAYIFISHKDNIDRLLSGTERKLGQKAVPVESSPPTPNKV